MRTLPSRCDSTYSCTLQVLWLSTISRFDSEYLFWFINIAFYVVLGYLVLDELWMMKGHCQKADLDLEEHILRQKLELKFKVLKHSAFKKLGSRGSRHSPYRPRVLLVQLAHVLDNTPEDRRHQIARLNELGRRVEEVRRSRRESVHSLPLRVAKSVSSSHCDPAAFYNRCMRATQSWRARAFMRKTRRRTTPAGQCSTLHSSSTS